MGVNGRLSPRGLVRAGPPTTPRRPKAMSRATPPTTGGRTTGTVITARSHVAARPSARESSQASGVPMAKHMATVTSVVRKESRIAGQTRGAERL